ncbi:trypsin-like peptidase domain-containing protein [Pontibacter sp. G13]|uniref:trypsin-like peptidase domain-containing protein n=1 Tax=Pontibacter sp. G13 TaxID=3074898 RepID=UPI00288B7FC3|nr:trypsin-like peptidase domain-containing protein [Pontibacter sp. G13]WNJ21403.1 trypsin-like peptidase domain-containing protein [Pontibacter sp. G13]
MKSFLISAIVSSLVCVGIIGAYHTLVLVPAQSEPYEETIYANSAPRLETMEQAPPADTRATHRMASQASAPANFHQAAELAMPAVVHITSVKNISQLQGSYYELFGLRPKRKNARQAVSTGSGVIVSSDGFIVTNNHVIKDADELEVTLNDNRKFRATVIGTDPSTDLGVIRIEGEDLPTIAMANSDEVLVGDWVLAVGNPFNLSSTATAGIVSAIGRDLHIIEDQQPIESFIQTDAAVNPGNSGGALVNIQGELIGVNTAIASPTGTFAGYAFAVPTNLVAKVIRDLREFGTVQRGYIGIIKAVNLNGEIARQNQLPITEGVLISDVAPAGGAAKAGIKPGAVITAIEGVPVKNDAKLLELVSRNRPGDTIDVAVFLDGGYKTFPVQLTDSKGNTQLNASPRDERLNKLGVQFLPLSQRELSRWGVDNGVKIAKLYAGVLRSQTNIQTGFVILEVNGKPVGDIESLTQTLNNQTGSVELTGFYPGYRRIYSYRVKL